MDRRPESSTRQTISTPGGEPGFGREQLLARLEDSFSSVYLTLTSIIQGAAFSYLAFVVASNFKSYSSTQWILSTTTLLAIIIAWNEYVMGVLSFVWVPTLFDALIPFLLGGTEMLLIQFISANPRPWYLAATLYSFVALLAFVNMYFQASRKIYIRLNHDILRVIGGLTWVTIIYAIGTVAVCAVLYVVDTQVVTVVIIATCGLTLAVGFLVRTWIYWARIRDYAFAHDE